MSGATVVDDVQVPVSERGPSPRKVIVAYGFWLFLLSDIIMFAALFAAYAVLSQHTAGGPGGPQLFNRGHVLMETACLLASSFTCGLFAIAVDQRHTRFAYALALSICLFGSAFLGLEASEFSSMVAAGAGPTRSAFLSAFFALVGLHGVHVAVGLFWLLVMLAQLATLGFHSMVVGRVRCFCLFWHALDIVWIGIFTIVYLGAK